MGMFRSSHRQAAFDFDLLMPETPVRRTSHARTDSDILDAEFVTIKETPRRDYGNDNRRAVYQQAKPRSVSAFAAVQSLMAWADRKLSGLSVDGYSALIAGAVVIVFALSGGLALLPKTQVMAAAPVEPLILSHVNVTPQDAGGMEILLITGIVENHGGKTEVMPAIRADLFASKGQLVASMLVEAPVPEIKPGLSHGFSAKLRHPGGKTPDIKLSFVETGVSQP